MAFSKEKCDKCGRTLANSKYIIGETILCPICYLGEKEGSQSKYWETSQEPKPEGFRYVDDTAIYDDYWDEKEKKWRKLKDKEG